MNKSFQAVHGAMQAWVDAEILAGASCALLSGAEVVDRHCAGWADKEAGVALRCLLYTSPSPRDATLSRMPSSA